MSHNHQDPLLLPPPSSPNVPLASQFHNAISSLISLLGVVPQGPWWAVAPCNSFSLTFPGWHFQVPTHCQKGGSQVCSQECSELNKDMHPFTSLSQGGARCYRVQKRISTP